MRRCLALAFLFVFCVSTSIFAQEVTGSIFGTVTDKTGAIVKDATVTVTNTDRNALIRTVKTNSNGQFSAPLLPIGHYKVSIEAPGFKTYTKNDIVLNVADKISVSAALEAGNVNEVVNVQANALHVDTISSAAAGLIDGTQIKELSLSARNYEEMVALMPGVSSAVSDTIYVGVETPGRGTNEDDFSINGSRFSQNNWTIDGADNVDRGGNFSLLNYPSVDAIQEFKVLRGQYEPEYGRGAGGQVDIVTRAGTSKFHGDIYEFFRNDFLNANYYLNKHVADPTQRLPRDTLRYNDFGWTLGGPIYIPGHYNKDKNKTFFFYSEEIRRVVTSVSLQATAPTDAERHGIFTDPVCTVPTFDPGTGACTGATSTTINPASFSPAAQAYLTDVFSHIPFPQDPSTDTLTIAGKNVFNYRQEIIRVDHTFSPKLMVTGRWMNDSIPTLNPSGLFGASNFAGYATTQTNSPGKNFLLRGTMTISPSLINEIGYAWSSGGIVSTPIGTSTFANSPDVVAAITLPTPSPLPRIPNINFNTGQSGLFSFGPYRDFNKNHNYFDTLTWAKGKHTLKFGVTYNRYQKNENDAGFSPSNGTFTFYDATQNVDPDTGQATTSFQQEWANFLLGNVQTYEQAKADFHARIRQTAYDFFGQDDFRLLPNLTVNFGLRYTYYGQAYDASNQSVNFDPKLYNPANAPQLDAAGQLVPGTGVQLNGVFQAGVNSPFGRALTRQTYNFAPRFGFSWHPFNKGKTAIRGGWGLFYDSPAVNYVENNEFGNPPFVGTQVISNTTFTNPAGGTPGVNTTPTPFHAITLDYHLPYTQMWSFDVQQELPFQTIVDVGYYGSTSRHLPGIIDINQPPAGSCGCITDADSAALLNLSRPFQGFGPINTYSTIFNANYHSLQTSVRKQFHGGSQISLNYTFSKALTNAPDDFYS